MHLKPALKPFYCVVYGSSAKFHTASEIKAALIWSGRQQLFLKNNYKR